MSSKGFSRILGGLVSATGLFILFNWSAAPPSEKEIGKVFNQKMAQLPEGSKLAKNPALIRGDAIEAVQDGRSSYTNCGLIFTIVGITAATGAFTPKEHESQTLGGGGPSDIGIG